MTFELWSNAQLSDAINTLMARAENDEALRSELDAQLADIYDALADPSLRDYAGAIDAAIDSHIAITDSLQSRAELLPAPHHGHGHPFSVLSHQRIVRRCFASLPRGRSHTLNPVLDFSHAEA